MRENIEKIIEIPEGVKVEVSGKKVKVSGNGKELEREFVLPKTKIEKTEKGIRLFVKNGTKKEGKLIGTAAAHIKNMINGIGEDFVYKLEICNVHFPMNVKVEGSEVVIKSFLGETVDRFAKILDGVKVDIKGNEVVVSSHDREKAGQTAANIEKAAKVLGRDRRIFQDGIFITEKPGRVI